MQAFICTTCGVQYEPSVNPPANCPVCDDDRQYINPLGQSWTTMDKLHKQYRNVIELVAENVYAIYTVPSFAIAQRAHLIISPGGNILWDCITLLDKSTVTIIKALGGIQAIAISHPHYFSAITDWSKAFGDIPVYVNAHDEQWLQRRSGSLKLWKQDELNLWDDIKLVSCGGHFPGASVLYNPFSKGSLFVGDTIQVAPDLQTVSFMYSYPNMIPLPEKDILQIREAVRDVNFDVMYGAFGRYISNNAKAATNFSIDRYLRIFR